MQPKVMRGRRPEADESGSGRFDTGPDLLREIARIAGDLGADEMVHDAVALAERPEAAPEMFESALARFTERLIFEIDERRAALMRPRALSGSHAAELRTAIVNAQQWLRDLSSEATAPDERLRAERDRFLAAAGDDGLQDMRDRRTAIERANELAAARVRQWAGALAPRLQELHAEAIDRHTAAIQKLIERIRAAGVPIDSDIAVDTALAVPHAEPQAVTPSFRWRRPPVIDEAREILRQALESGSQQVMDAFHEAFTLSQRRLEWEIALRLRATADSLKRAADAATEAQREGAPGIANELNRIDELARRLAKVRP